MSFEKRTKANAAAPARTSWWSRIYSRKYFKTQINKYLMREHGPLDRICAKLNNIDSKKTKEFEGEVFQESDFAISLDDIRNHLEGVGDAADEYTISLARKLLNNQKGKLRKSVADYMNSKVDEVIQRSLKLTTSDFKQLFWSLRSKLKKGGMRLTLFIEDINAFTGIDLALMDVLVANHASKGNEEYCRLASVVGTTNDFYKNRLNDSLRDRVKDVGAEIYIRTESLFGDRQRLVEFAAKYINACMIPKKESLEWEKNTGCDETELPIAFAEYNFSKEICFGREMTIFPFNSNAICNLYERLNSFSKTPRRFILDVLYPVLNLYYSSPEEFLDNEAAFKNDSITSLNDFKKPGYTIINDTRVGGPDAGKRSLLLRIWGDSTTEVRGETLGGLDKEIFDVFHVDMMLDQFRAFSNDKSIDVDSSIPSTTEPSVNESPKGKKDSGISSKTGNSTKNQNYERVMKAVRDWANNPRGIIAQDQELKRLVSGFVYGNMEWDVEEIPRPIIDAYIKSYRYINIEGQNAKIREDGFTIKRSQESMYLFYALLGYKYLGENSWNFESGLDYYNLAMAWLINHHDEILKIVRAPYESIAPFQEILICSAYCIKLFNGGMGANNTPETAMIELFNGKIDYSLVHSNTWNSVYNDLLKVLQVNNAEEYLNRVCNYFAKATGQADTSNRKYVFVDAHRIITILKKLIDSNWNLQKYYLVVDKSGKQDLWYKAPQILGIVYRNKNNLIDSEMEIVKKYTTYFGRKISNYTDSKQVEETLEKVTKYLLYITMTRNLSYDSDKIPTLSNRSSLSLSNSIAEEMAVLDRINKAETIEEKINGIALNPFDHVTNIYEELQYFDLLLQEKNEKFKSGINVGVNDQINNIRSSILAALDRMITIGQEVNE